ncbi:hypothetical protein Ae201684_008290 [Aphanomyces euteiches]|uniref:Tyr recombinase domain-containing protein n=1 Tax=Aphanomyces euteiches TaxID=100861 RepID=A0A6G0X5B3_9STRA|nr:hypothetical protein Ae201684_008290 [Aphanomyces euteiches]
MKVIFSARDLQNGDKMYTGKRPMTFSLFGQLCSSSLALDDRGFTHLYLILSWNLMCRSKSTETIRFDYISWEDDAIGFTFHRTTTAQEGTKNKDPKHCFANPLNPSLCLFLALAIYLACNPQIEPTSLFPGSKQKDRFGKSLARLLAPSKVVEHDRSKEKVKKEIGTHSIRKGAATFVYRGAINC